MRASPEARTGVEGCSPAGSRGSSAPEHETMRFCCLSHHIWGALGQEPWAQTPRAEGRWQIWGQRLRLPTVTFGNSVASIPVPQSFFLGGHRGKGQVMESPGRESAETLTWGEEEAGGGRPGPAPSHTGRPPPQAQRRLRPSRSQLTPLPCCPPGLPATWLPASWPEQGRARLPALAFSPAPAPAPEAPRVRSTCRAQTSPPPCIFLGPPSLASPWRRYLGTAEEPLGVPETEGGEAHALAFKSGLCPF